jgi:hypothetical protein
MVTKDTGKAERGSFLTRPPTKDRESEWRCHRRNRKPGKSSRNVRTLYRLHARIRIYGKQLAANLTSDRLQRHRIVITGNLPGVYSWRSYFRMVVQRLWHQCLRVLCSPRLWRGTESAITTVNRPRNPTTQFDHAVGGIVRVKSHRSFVISNMYSY